MAKSGPIDTRSPSFQGGTPYADRAAQHKQHPKAVRVLFHTTGLEYEAYRQAADAEGVSLSEWLRQAMRAALHVRGVDVGAVASAGEMDKADRSRERARNLRLMIQAALEPGTPVQHLTKTLKDIDYVLSKTEAK